MKVLQENGLKAFMTSILNKFIKKTDTVEVSTIEIDNAPTQNSSNLVTSGGVYSALSNKENLSNKVTSLSNQSTDTQYPSAKCVYDNLGTKQNVIDNNNKLSYFLLTDTPTIPTVDQTFSSSSANAQSGVAVATILSEYAKENFYKKFLEYDIAGNNIIVNGSKKVDNYIPADFIVPDYIDGRLVYEMSETFKNKTDIASVLLPDNLQSISTETFKGCTGLTNVTIPSKVTLLGDSCFQGCTGLTRVYIPKSVNSIGSNIFDGCTALTSILYEGSQADLQRIVSGSPSWLNLVVYNSGYLTLADLPIYNGGVS